MFVAALGMYHAMVAAHAEVAGFKRDVLEIQSHQQDVIERLARIEQAATDIRDEQDRQREWRERIEYVAERDRIPRRRK